MLIQQPPPALELVGAQGVDDLLVVGPHVGPVLVALEAGQLAGVVGVPVGDEQAMDERVVQAAEDGQVQLPVFGVGNVNRFAAQLAPGAVDQVA